MADPKIATMDQTEGGAATVANTFKKFGATTVKFFERAVQMTEETFGNAPKTDLEDLEGHRQKVWVVKEQTDLIVKELEAFLDPSTGFWLEKLVPGGEGSAIPPTKYSKLAAILNVASNAYGENTPFGNLLAQLADAEDSIGSEYLRFVDIANKDVGMPLAALKADFTSLAAEEKNLNNARLDLDVAKGRARKASSHGRTESADVEKLEQEFEAQYDKVVEKLTVLAEVPAMQAALLQGLVEVQLEFHQRSAIILEKLLANMPSSVEVEGHIRDSLGEKPASKLNPRTVHPPLSAHDDGLELGTFVAFPAKAKALFDFTGTTSTELSLKVGTEVEVKDRIDNEFVLCEQNGKTGKVPVAYLMPV